MALLILLLVLANGRICPTTDSYLMQRIEACNNLSCDSSSKLSVCGLRTESGTMRLRIFPNECALLKYGCSVTQKDAYGLISMEYCRRSDIVESDENAPGSKIDTKKLNFSQNFETNNECRLNCNYLDEDVVCGIREDGDGFRVKQFENMCELNKHNCNASIQFIRTDAFICEGTLQHTNSSNSNVNNTSIYKVSTDNKSIGYSKSIVLVDGSMLGQTTDANETIENFFAATHVLDLPIREIDDTYKTRRMLLKHVGPVKVFEPWINIPKTIKTDFQHMPTLSTCYHKCPTQCPDTYSPVCGVPGILAREPSIMFKNHCYMDVAQCKMYWENKSSTAISSSYIESSFLFCLGDQLNGMYRFLPLIKTLQHMGRLKKKGKFRYRLNNMRFFNNYAYKEPKLMG